MVSSLLNKVSALLDKFLDLSWLAQDRSQKKQSGLRRWAAILVIAGIFGFLLYKSWTGIHQILSQGINFNFGFLLLSVACQAIGVTIAVYVWGDILKIIQISSPFIYNFEVYCVSAIARKIPGGVWYAFSRIAAYSHIQKSKWLLLIAVVIEALVSVLAGGLDLGLSILFGYSNLDWGFSQNTLGFIILGILGVIIFISPAIVKYVVNHFLVKEKSELASLVRIQRIDIIRWVFAEAVVLFLASGVGYFLFKAIDLTRDPSFFILSGSFNLGVVLSPIAMWLPGNAGVRDSIIYLALQGSVGDGVAALITLAWRIWVYLLETLAGTMCIVDLKHRLTNYHIDNSRIET